MTNWHCENCSLTGTDLGEWDSEHPYFKNILQVHKLHNGFKEGKIKKKSNLEGVTDEQINKLLDKMFHVLIHSCKGPTKSCLLRGAIDAI